MSIWGKVVGGVAGFALGGPLGAILGAGLGHVIDRAPALRRAIGRASVEARQSAYAVAVVVLAAKMAKVDGHVSRQEIDAFKRIFHIPASEIRAVARLWNAAKHDAHGFEPYARQIGDMFAHDPAVLETLLGALFQVALADGKLHPNEIRYLEHVAHAFGLDSSAFERIRSVHVDGKSSDPYDVLGVARGASSDEIKRAWRKLVREHHPDTLIAKGVPKELVDAATEKVAAINAAYESLEKERSVA